MHLRVSECAGVQLAIDWSMDTSKKEGMPRNWDFGSSTQYEGGHPHAR